jgi:hypothetical protein
MTTTIGMSAAGGRNTMPNGPISIIPIGSSV